VGFAFAPDGRRALTFTKDGTATVWNLENGQSVSVVLNLGEPPLRGQFSPDGRFAVAAGRSGIRVWDTTVDSPAVVAIACPPEVRHLDFSRDGRTLVAAGPENAVWDWDTATGQPLGPPIRHADSPAHVACSPDGTRVLVAWTDGTARVWDVATGRPAGPTLTAHDDLLASFSPDGRLACFAGGPEVRLWDATTGQPASPVFSAPAPVSAAAFVADGSTLRTLARFHTAQDWHIRPDPRPADEILVWAQLIASRRIDTFGGLVPLSPAEHLAAFRDLKAQSPAAFAVPPRAAALWRWHEALACYRDCNWPGAALHLRWLARETAARQLLTP
jgi:WD40 repeat protein